MSSRPSGDPGRGPNPGRGPSPGTASSGASSRPPSGTPGGAADGRDGARRPTERFAEALLWIHAVAYVPQLVVPALAGTTGYWWVALVYLAMLAPTLAPIAALRQARRTGYPRVAGYRLVAGVSVLVAVVAAVLFFMLGSLTVQLAVPLVLWAVLVRRRLLAIGAGVALAALLVPVGAFGMSLEAQGIPLGAAVVEALTRAVPPLALFLLAGLQRRRTRTALHGEG
ncbi:hypothetical protein [Zhihengliuella sp.]|uniref:hypothetical protein n=1 Tax=Zhihengliuella sp. TaxID=1954483 RepID=UPI002810DD93|nr:hypothetical protein [Zhihengliuella sp.]